MRYFYSCDQVKRGLFDVKWHPHQENLGDYQSKNHLGKDHVHVCPMYLHMRNLPEFLLQAMKPSELRGSVGNKMGAYVCGHPYPYSLSTAHKRNGQLPEKHRSG